MAVRTCYHRRVIKIRATDSPNVRLGLEQAARGEAPTHEVLIPGVLPYADYLQRRATWDPVRQMIGLDAEFYEGAELMLYPVDWLNQAEQRHAALVATGRQRRARAIGCDPGEGVASSAWAVVDEYGLIELLSLRTPDTTVIPDTTLMLMRKYGVPALRVCLDRGGGGKQHADTLRRRGHQVRTVAFGESVIPGPQRGRVQFSTRREAVEEKYVYVNRRAQLYGELRELLDPAGDGQGRPRLALPATYHELRRQLAPIPLQYDQEGRLVMMPKSKRDRNDKRPTLTELIGHSPDEADALVLAVHAMLHASSRAKAGAVR